jgi:formylglycine-generating enzyme required for sulfatase activity
MRAILLFSGLAALSLVAAQAADQPYINSIKMEFMPIPAGCFLMGRDPAVEKGYERELPQHKVCIAKPFYLGKTEVTQAQWEAVMGSNPAGFKAPDYPVEQISWEAIQIFIQKLNQKEGCECYRLPTEAEWEYAARAGTTTIYHFGNDPALLKEYAWYADNSGDKTHAVAQLKPNPWGLYDMHGNVREWVADLFDAHYYQASPQDDPAGPASGQYRVVRGGSWYSDADYCRAANRHDDSPVDQNDRFGFRLARISK